MDKKHGFLYFLCEGRGLRLIDVSVNWRFGQLTLTVRGTTQLSTLPQELSLPYSSPSTWCLRLLTSNTKALKEEVWGRVAETKEFQIAFKWMLLKKFERSPYIPLSANGAYLCVGLQGWWWCSMSKNSAMNQKPGLQSHDFGRNTEWGWSGDGAGMEWGWSGDGGGKERGDQKNSKFFP